MIYFSVAVALLGFIIPLCIIIKKEKLKKKKSVVAYIAIQVVLVAVFCFLNCLDVAIYDMGFYVAGLCVFYALSYIDLKEKVVDTHLMLVLLSFAAISCVRFDFQYIISHIGAAIVGYLIMLIIKKIKSEQIGLGDVRIVPVIGLALGVGALFRTMVVGMLIMALYSVVGMLLKRINLKSELPMLPFVCAGWMLCII